MTTANKNGGHASSAAPVLLQLFDYLPVFGLMGRTFSIRRFDALPAVTVTVAVPSRKATIRPGPTNRTTPGFDVVQTIGCVVTRLPASSNASRRIRAVSPAVRRSLVDVSTKRATASAETAFGGFPFTSAVESGPWPTTVESPSTASIAGTAACVLSAGAGAGVGAGTAAGAGTAPFCIANTPITAITPTTPAPISIPRAGGNRVRSDSNGALSFAGWSATGGGKTGAMVVSVAASCGPLKADSANPKAPAPTRCPSGFEGATAADALAPAEGGKALTGRVADDGRAG